MPEQVDLSQSSYSCVCSKEEGKNPKTLCRSQGFLLIGSSPNVPGKESEIIRCVMSGDIQALPEVLQHVVSRARAKKKKYVFPCSQSEPFRHSALTAPAFLTAQPSTVGNTSQ